MATPKVLLKRSSVVGRIPDSSDLQYGELAINFADGKLYYKDDSNNIKAFIDSARVQAIADAIGGLDSSEVTALIDSAYVQARQTTYNTSDFTDSAFVTGLPVSTFTNDANYLDSTTTTQLIDSAYVLARAPAQDFLDSAEAINLIDSAYIRARVRTDQDLRTTDDVTFGKITGDSAVLEKLQFNTTVFTDVSVPDNLPADPPNEGDLFYFQGPDALTYSNASINVKIGQDEVVRVYNNSGSDIAKGKAVYVTGAANDFPTISLAKADNFSTIYTTIGLTSHAITNGAFGFVTMRGLYGGLNTVSFNAGDIVHVSVDSAGELTNSQPAYPNFPFEIGTVLVSDSPGGGNVGGCIQVNLKAEVFEGIRVQGNSRFDADLTVAGNLNILGAETITQVQNLQVTDNFIYIGAGDTVTTLFDGTGTNDGLIKDYYEGDSSKYYFVYIYDADSVNGGDLIRLERGDSAGAFDDGTSIQINFDSAGGSETLDLSVDRTLLPLRNNIKITFETAGGHDSGDYWYGLAAPVNQDLGIVGNYNLPDAPYSHAGFFRDADDQKFKVFNKYDPEVTGNINTSHASFELGTMVAQTFEGNLTGNVTGTVSDISNHSTTELSEGNNLYYTTARHDSDTLIQVDSAYVQARQDFVYVDSAYVQLRILDSNDAITGLQSTQFNYNATQTEFTVTVVAKDATHRYNGQGSGNGYKIDGTFAPTIVLVPGNTYRFDQADASNSGHPLAFYYEADKTTSYSTNVTTNGTPGSAGAYTEIEVTDATPMVLHYQCTAHAYMGNMVATQTRNFTGFDTDDLSEGSTNQYYTNTRANSAIDARVTKTFVDNLGIAYTSLSGTPTIPTLYNDFVDSSEVVKLITANAIDSSVALQLLLDSSEVVNLIDSAYIQARQSGGEITIQDEGTPLSTGATTLNFTGLAVTATGSGATKTITISQAEGGTDSATVVTIIGDTVDSAYVQARQAAGTDSAATISLIQSTVDSAYVQLREAAAAGLATNGAYTQTFFRYNADSGQTAITGTDLFGKSLDYLTGQIDVFLNGILLVDSADYTETNNSTVTIESPLDSGDEVNIIFRKGLLVTPNVKVYEYTAAAGGQATFTGSDLNGNTLAYSAGAVQIFVNGILLKSTDDYTATNGTSVVLTTGADSGDDVSIAAYAAPAAKATSFTFTADSSQSVFNGLDNKGLTLSYEATNSLVFLNGIVLNDSDDFTATNGTSVTLTTAANLNDELKVVSFGSVTTTQSSNNWTETSTSIKISPNEKKFVDVSSAAITLEIQDSGNNVSMGDELRIIDGYGNAASNNITVRSTKKIIGSDSDLIIDINRSGTNLVYYNESNGWVLIEN